MKKIYLILIMFNMFLVLITTSLSYAENTEITLSGDDKISPGEKGKITVKLTSDQLLTSVVGEIETSSNITNIEIISKNKWTYFNMEDEEANDYTDGRRVLLLVNFTGKKVSDEIADIEYTVSNTEGQAWIKLKGLTAGREDEPEDYLVELGDVTKEIAIVKKETSDDFEKDDQDEDNQGEDDQGNNGQQKDEDSQGKDNQGNNGQQRDENNQGEDNQENNGQQKDEVKNTTTPSTTKDMSKTASEKTVVKNTSATSGKTNLPKTGVAGVLIPTSILILCIVGAIMFFRYKKYKGIK